MSAPALIALAHGSRDPRSARTVREIVATTKALRPDLKIEPAFLDHVASRPRHRRRPAGRQGPHRDRRRPAAADRRPTTPGSTYPRSSTAAAARHPGLGIRVAEVVGTDASLLAVLDVRLREALRESRVRELDALVLAAAGTSDARANAKVGAAGAALGPPAPPAHERGVRLDRSPVDRRGRPRVAAARTPPRRGGVAVHRPGQAARPGRGAGLEAGAVAVSAPLGAHDELRPGDPGPLLRRRSPARRDPGLKGC